MNSKGESAYKNWEKAIKEKDLMSITNLIIEYPNLINQGIIHYRSNGTTFQTLPLNMVNTSLEATKLLLHKGADPNAYGDGNVLALHNAPLEVTQLLVSKGADVNKIGYEECTPIMYEVYMNNMDNVEFLLSVGADVNYQRNLDGYTSLHWAAQKSDLKMIKLLLDSGAQTEIKNTNGQTAMDLAKQRGDDEVLELLQKAGSKQHL